MCVQDMDTILSLTRDLAAEVRRAAVTQLCPCRVQRDVRAFWTRVFEMAADPDDGVRARVLHILCDGSPAHLEDAVVSTIEDVFNRDSNRDIRHGSSCMLCVVCVCCCCCCASFVVVTRSARCPTLMFPQTASAQGFGELQGNRALEYLVMMCGGTIV